MHTRSFIANKACYWSYSILIMFKWLSHIVFPGPKKKEKPVPTPGKLLSDPLYEVEKILAKRYNTSKKVEEYLIKWKKLT